MDIFERIRALNLPPTKPTYYDVAIVMRDEDGSPRPVVTCVMEEDEFWGLEEDWMKAIAAKEAGPVAGCYWVKVGDSLGRHGFVLTNIVSVMGVVMKPQSEGEK